MTRDRSEERTRSTTWQGDASTPDKRLVVLWEGGWLSHSIADGTSVVLGRSKECDLQIDHPSISRRHVRIDAGPPTTVVDLGSANGSRLGGVPVGTTRGSPFGDEQLLEIGGAVVILRTGADGAVPLARSSASTAPAGETASQAFRRLVGLVAASHLSVLLTGETGVGKEVAAEAIHRGSHRAAGPFVKVNCAALADSLLESELFGHEKGAFTGAQSARFGLFEAADRGTIFLDEVGEMPLATQAKVLRVLESREVLPVGAVRPRSIDVRVVAATNRDVGQQIQEGAFRSDLYFRLNGMTIRIPPLRERRAEIVPLVEAFVARAAAEHRVRPAPLDGAVLRALQRHDWPGNVRELKNVVERALVLANGAPVAVDHLVFDSLPASTQGSRGMPLRDDVRDFERERIVRALEDTQGNQTRAAELLRLSRRTLVSRIEALGLPRPRKR